MHQRKTQQSLKATEDRMKRYINIYLIRYPGRENKDNRREVKCFKERVSQELKKEMNIYMQDAQQTRILPVINLTQRNSKRYNLEKKFIPEGKSE